MYAQAFEANGSRPEDLNQIICRELLPALRDERGFSGALSLVDLETPSMLLLVFWETQEEATRPLPPYFTTLLARLGVPDPAANTPRVWEVGARA